MARVNTLKWIVAGALATVACAAPSTVSSPVKVAQQGVAPAPDAEQIAYAMMAAVAIRQSRFMTSTKTVGLYQGDDVRAPLYPIIKHVLERNAYREIRPGEAKIACTVPRRAGLRGSGAAGQTCGLDVVDVLLQINSVQIMRDSGYVGGYLTEVIPNEGRPKAIAYCFIAVHRGDIWYDVRNSIVKEPRDCAADRKH